MEELIPIGWQTVSIGEVTLPIEKTDPSRNPNQVIDYLDISGIDNKSNRILEAKHYLGKDAPSRARQLIKQEDILFSTVRTYLKNIAMVPVEYDGQVASTGFSILRAAEGINSKFLFYYTLTQDFLNPLTELQRGSSYPAVRDDDVRIQKIPIAPYNEQKRIVAKIEELFSELDKGIENLKTAREQLKVYRQAVLKHAFEGKLTAHWREQNKDKLESANQLLERIGKERETYYKSKLEEWKKGNIAKPKTIHSISELSSHELEELFPLPESWEWVRWENILDYEDGAFKRGPFGSTLKKEFFVKHSKYKVYEQYCPINDDCSFERYYISEEKFRELGSFAVRADDFLISCSGVTLGRITQVPAEFKEGIINQALLRVRLNKIAYDFGFFKLLFRSRYFQKRIFENSTGTAIPNVKGVNELKAIAIPLCSIAEQGQILQEIGKQFSIIDKLQSDVDENLKKSEALRQSILKKAFSGKLVAQDPKDEPASVLLERIRAEKEAQKTESKKPKTKREAA